MTEQEQSVNRGSMGDDQISSAAAGQRNADTNGEECIPKPPQNKMSWKLQTGQEWLGGWAGVS